jgi:hypothetical protein
LGERPKSIYKKSARKLQKKKAPRLCGLCRQAGYTRPFCPDRDKVNIKYCLVGKTNFIRTNKDTTMKMFTLSLTTYLALRSGYKQRAENLYVNMEDAHKEEQSEMKKGQSTLKISEKIKC